jgi:hypothetical protein
MIQIQICTTKTNQNINCSFIIYYKLYSAEYYFWKHTICCTDLSNSSLLLVVNE